MAYFDRFPVISYNGTLARNITARVALTDVAARNASLYYPYTVKDGQRPDTIAYDYYKNSDYVWLIALTNGIVDLYYDVPIADSDVDNLLIQKYGSIPQAIKTILFYRNNWVNDDSNLDQSTYDAFPPNVRRYFTPQLGTNGVIIDYVRKHEDWQVTTNTIENLALTSVVGTFELGERLLNGSTPSCTIDFVGTSSLVVKHVIGSVGASITGETSGATATVSLETVISQPIASSEAVYWAPVTAYDHAHELNQQARSIRLLDNRFSPNADRLLKQLLSS